MNIVLVNPQIPQNTGSIARTCAALNWPLHLIKPLGFEIDEKRVRRAGLDYWPAVTLTEHESFEAFLTAVQPSKCWCLSTKGSKYPWEAKFLPNEALIFGSETKGLGEAFLSQHPADQIIKLPMLSSAVRSLNLSNVVTAVAYEALRQNAGFYLGAGK